MDNDTPNPPDDPMTAMTASPNHSPARCPQWAALSVISVNPLPASFVSPASPYGVAKPWHDRLDHVRAVDGRIAEWVAGEIDAMERLAGEILDGNKGN